MICFCVSGVLAWLCHKIEEIPPEAQKPRNIPKMRQNQETWKPSQINGKETISPQTAEPFKVKEAKQLNAKNKQNHPKLNKSAENKKEAVKPPITKQCHKKLETSF